MPSAGITNRSGAPPDPHGVRSLDELTDRLHALQAWAGLDYHEVHRRVVALRSARGIPEHLAYNTVYRCLGAVEGVGAWPCRAGVAVRSLAPAQ